MVSEPENNIRAYSVRRLSLLTSAMLIAWGASGAAFAFTTEDGSTEVNGFIENATYHRKDVGLSKFRNTIQIEASKQIGEAGIFSNVSLNGTFRGTYDAVYDLNDDEYGNRAGGAIDLESVGPGIETPWGQSPVGAGFLIPGPGFPTGFGFDTVANPNEGLEVLGARLHKTDGGVTLGVPVRPCDKDSRGCLKDYMDADLSELRHPEFNDRLDFIREAYLNADINIEGGRILNLKVGKQQIVWGRTDLFRVLDVLNPVDYSRHNIYDELEDIRIPMWMAQLEYRMGATNTFDDLNFSMVWNFDKFRPSNLGQGGSPYAILDAGSFFRGMKNCWDNGCTVSNFAGGAAATDFPKHTIGIRKVHMPDWSLSNTQLGAKVEGEFKGVGFSVNALTYRSHLPSLRGGIAARNPFIADGVLDPIGTGETGGDELVRPYLIAFDMYFPRINLVGASLDFYSDALKSVFRIEGAYTTGEEFANTLKPRLFSDSDVFRYVVGWDRPTFIPFLNKKRAFLISAQVFGQHILDHDSKRVNGIDVGIPDEEVNHIATLLVKGWFKNDRVSPQVIFAHDFGAKATTIAPSVDWLVSDNLRVTFGANIKVGDGAQEFDDCRSCNPFPGYTDGGAGLPEGTLAIRTLAGFEPLGRFRSGPIGMAQKEDEVQLSVRYRF